MRLKEHIASIQQKPQHQRERIAVIATAVAFLVILAIWLLTFSEMNKSTQPVVDSSATDQLNDLKSSAGEGKKSIEEMWSEMPTQEDMINAEQQVAPPENSINSSETVPPDENENKGSEIPSLP